MSFFPGIDPVAGDAFACDAIENLIIPRTSDIGGFSVRRALPTRQRRLVGPFIFFDRMGPALLRADEALDVKPHPHIGLSTVTYLFDGEIKHRDSLGTELVIRPGDINLMTAGRGIVHSERTPENLRGHPMSVSGLQTWLALPDDKEEINPAFSHTGKENMPVIDADGANGRVVIGAFEGLGSPVSTFTDTLYVDLRLAAGKRFPFAAAHEERAIYILSGELVVSGDRFAADQLLVFRPGDDITLEAGAAGCHVMLFGGAALNSKRFIWWNFVSSSKERIEKAKEEWRTGRFDIVPGDEEEFVPLPTA
ncbi:pirin family protein [Neorhizobium galegae]|uniref:pirin family protein n=1 Tax=Neorhizobium galegae TaxID=399 RepID=UPI000621E1CF|nr:pirin family protein [Neorhizobium galegae]CDZ28774.1 Pirin domain protein [Neorhizobium galegae bv. officinalis]KAA9386142.1 pirin family protein [Neorhizobium galegae]KAB1113415.1 pirin family protein [Neorhizobium galegae]MCM2496372.1 pirin family protein [Neorhizobium galegae]MCQ1770492.1 pirin family protein [Neorhizobium galegae]